MSDTIYEREAETVRRFLHQIETVAADGERTLAETAGAVLGDYGERLRRARVPKHTVAPAQMALGVLIDQAARRVPRLNASAWRSASHVHLFNRREMSEDAIRRFRDTARNQGREYRALAEFLEGVVAEFDQSRRSRATVSRRPAWLIAGAAGALVLALAIYAL
ncbi:MAG: hypothetical protein AAF914_09460, partial [Pseudomonadota bacterium]